MPNSPLFGTRVTLACLLTDVPVPVPPQHPDRCGSCRRGVQLCPTGALLGDRRVDLNLCISYRTTRHEELVPPESWSKIGDWLFGCDICQDVCPWNWKAEGWFWEGFKPDPELAHPNLADFLTLSEPDFARKYASSAFARMGRTRMVRNALIVLSNTRDRAYLPLMRRAAEEDVAPLVRATAARALVELEDRKSAERLLRDPVDVVRKEARSALR